MVIKSAVVSHSCRFLDCNGIGVSIGGMLESFPSKAYEDVDCSAGWPSFSSWAKGFQDVDGGSSLIEGFGPKLMELNLQDEKSDSRSRVVSGEDIGRVLTF